MGVEDLAALRLYGAYGAGRGEGGDYPLVRVEEELDPGDAHDQGHRLHEHEHIEDIEHHAYAVSVRFLYVLRPFHLAISVAGFRASPTSDPIDFSLCSTSYLPLALARS